MLTSHISIHTITMLTLPKPNMLSGIQLKDALQNLHSTQSMRCAAALSSPSARPLARLSSTALCLTTIACIMVVSSPAIPFLVIPYSTIPNSTSNYPNYSFSHASTHPSASPSRPSSSSSYSSTSPPHSASFAGSVDQDVFQTILTVRQR